MVSNTEFMVIVIATLYQVQLDFQGTIKNLVSLVPSLDSCTMSKTCLSCCNRGGEFCLL